MPLNLQIAVAMGSHSDWETMQKCCEKLDELDMAYEERVVSAHRTPNLLPDYTKDIERRGCRVLIAAAGGAAHLPGMLAAHTLLPVLGVPVATKTLGGIDSLLSIVQMPRGIAVGTLAIGQSGAVNAALLAAQIIALNDPKTHKKLAALRKQETDKIIRHPIPHQNPGK